MKIRMCILVLILLCSCEITPETCKGLEGYISYGEKGFPIIKKDLINYYPECANELAAHHGVDNFHAATFEERWEVFGSEWEEEFKREACEEKTLSSRPPSICT